LPTVSRLNFLRAVTAFAALTAVTARAEQPTPVENASKPDIRQALIFTGHYKALDNGQSDASLRRASQSWQMAKSYKVTESLPDEEIGTLLSDGLKQRYALGWTMLHDKSIGLDIGVPTKFVKFVGAQTSNAALEYKFEGDIGYKLFVRYGDSHCGTMDSFYAYLVNTYRPSYATRKDNWFAIVSSANGIVNYSKAICSPSAIALATVSLSGEQAGVQAVLLAAMADSFSLSSRFNPTASPRPKLDEPPARPEGYREGETVAPPKAAELPPDVDGLGKTHSAQLATRGGTELRAEQVFQQAGAAVYVVKALPRLGSAVAISDSELLTNCHVVGDSAQVTLIRDRKEMTAKLVSRNAKADRCVLRAEAKLPAWVRIRSYESISTGERAFSIGAPSGLELTVAEGIVSSKRTPDDRRYIQTSAPISPGSSGGGLFDAQGHLLGITTFHILNAQNLNFAIAAEEYSK
jgi:S1-C subfamily serine protease